MWFLLECFLFFLDNVGTTAAAVATSVVVFVVVVASVVVEGTDGGNDAVVWGNSCSSSFFFILFFFDVTVSITVAPGGERGGDEEGVVQLIFIVCRFFLPFLVDWQWECGSMVESEFFLVTLEASSQQRNYDLLISGKRVGSVCFASFGRISSSFVTQRLCQFLENKPRLGMQHSSICFRWLGGCGFLHGVITPHSTTRHPVCILSVGIIINYVENLHKNRSSYV